MRAVCAHVTRAVNLQCRCVCVGGGVRFGTTRVTQRVAPLPTDEQRQQFGTQSADSVNYWPFLLPRCAPHGVYNTAGDPRRRVASADDYSVQPAAVF